MKARDIIKGWPRPRTFVSPGHRRDWVLAVLRGDPEFCRYVLDNERYHESQQRMNDAYFERWRNRDVLTGRGFVVNPFLAGDLPRPASLKQRTNL